MMPLHKGNHFSDGSALERLVEKTLDWIIKILINAAGGILKRAADNALETKSRAERVESCRGRAKGQSTNEAN